MSRQLLSFPPRSTLRHDNDPLGTGGGKNGLEKEGNFSRETLYPGLRLALDRFISL